MNLNLEGHPVHPDQHQQHHHHQQLIPIATADSSLSKY